jgi:hypothetical protein
MRADDGEKLVNEEIVGLCRTLAFEDAGKDIVEYALHDLVDIIKVVESGGEVKCLQLFLLVDVLEDVLDDVLGHVDIEFLVSACAGC